MYDCCATISWQVMLAALLNPFLGGFFGLYKAVCVIQILSCEQASLFALLLAFHTCNQHCKALLFNITRTCAV